MITLGVRSNEFSSSSGLIKYFDSKMNFRDIKYSMLNKEEINKLTAKKKGVGASANLLEKFETYSKSN